MNILLKINIAFLALLLLALAAMLEESPLNGVWKSGVAQVTQWFEPQATGEEEGRSSADKDLSSPDENLALVPIVPSVTAASKLEKEAQKAGLEASDPFAGLHEDPATPKPMQNPHRAMVEHSGTDLFPLETAMQKTLKDEPSSVGGAPNNIAEGANLHVTKAKNVTPLLKGVPLRIATEGNFPPFNFTNGDGELAGFEVDLVHALCTQIKRECEIMPQAWASLLPGLIAGKWDLVMASMRIPGKTVEGVVYTKPYYRLPAQLVVRKGDVSNRRVPNPAGKEIMLQSGSRHEAYVMQHFPNALRRTVPTFDEAWDRFVLGEAMFFFGDRVAILQRMAGTQCCMLAGTAIVDADFFSQGVGFALSNAEPSHVLKTQLENGLSALIAEGTYGDISTRYFNENIF